MTFTTVVSTLGSAGGITVLLLMAASPFLAELLLPGPRRGEEPVIPEQRTSADPVRRPAHAA